MIADYYIESSIFKEMSLSENFKNSSIEHIIEVNKDKLRNNSSIVDFDDLLNVLHYLTFWNVNFIPRIVYNYLDLELFKDYSELNKYENIISGEIIDSILAYTKSKFERRKSISCGEYFSIFIQNNGELLGYGDNELEQINVPSGKFIQVASGAHHSIAIKENEELAVWGFDMYNQLKVPSGKFIQIASGDGFSMAISKSNKLIGIGSNQKDIPSGNFTWVSCGKNFSVAIKQNKKLFAWGKNEYNQLNVPKGKYIFVSCGAHHSIAIKENGKLVGWGNNDYGQIDVPDGRFISVACAYTHSFGLRENGELVRWPEYTSGMKKTMPNGKFVQIACGSCHAIALRENGELVGWGNNSFGQINVPSISTYYLESQVFKEMFSSENFKNLTFEAVIQKYSDNLRNDNQVEDLDDFISILQNLTFWDVTDLPHIIYDFLDNNLFEEYYLLREFENVISSKFIDDILKYIKSKFETNVTIGCKYDSFIAIRSSKNVELDGKLDSELVGYENLFDTGDLTITRNLPTGRFIQVACGMGFSIAIRKDEIEDRAGELVGWGENWYGENWYGETNVPTGKFLQVACGNDFSVAIRGNDENKMEGELVAWGNDENGQTNVPEGKFQKIFCCSYISIGIRGGNDENRGELVYWPKSNSSKFPPGKFIDISVAHGCLYAIRDNGELAIWSLLDNIFLQTPIIGNKIIKIAILRYFSIAITQYGELLYVESRIINPKNLPIGRFTQIVSKCDRAIALREDGELFIIHGDGSNKKITNLFI